MMTENPPSVRINDKQFLCSMPEVVWVNILSVLLTDLYEIKLNTFGSHDSTIASQSYRNQA